MLQETRNRIASLLEPRKRLNLWEYLCQRVSFPPDYPTSRPGKYDSESYPFWREPCERFTDDETREMAILKAGQLGASQGLVIGSSQFFASECPRNVLAIFPSMDRTEEFIFERLKPAWRKCSERNLLRGSTWLNNSCTFDSGAQFYFTHSTSKQGLATRPAEVVVADEIDLFDGDVLARARTRQATYADSKLCVLSTPHSVPGRRAEDSPIMREYMRGDCRRWMMPDPAFPADATKRFFFEMGWKDKLNKKESVYGLKWDASAEITTADGKTKWDLRVVEATAFYQTPAGTRIDDAQRLALIRQGQWHPTKQSEVPGVFSYHLNAFYNPSSKFSFGKLAVKFLEAHRSHDELRIFVQETLGEQWRESSDAKIKPDELAKREKDYPRKTGNVCSVERVKAEFPDYEVLDTCFVLTADVQKDWLAYVVRQHFSNGDSWLLDYGQCVSFDELQKIVDDFGCAYVLIDSGHRTATVYAECFARGSSWIATKGSSKFRDGNFLHQQQLDPWLGSKGKAAGNDSIDYLVFDANHWKNELYELTRNGNDNCRWFLPSKTGDDYKRELQAEEKRNGEWVKIKKHFHNEFLDCEVLQCCASHILHYFKGCSDMETEPELEDLESEGETNKGG